MRASLRVKTLNDERQKIARLFVVIAVVLTGLLVAKYSWSLHDLDDLVLKIEQISGVYLPIPEEIYSGVVRQHSWLHIYWDAFFLSLSFLSLVFAYCVFAKLLKKRDLAEAEVVDLNLKLANQLDEKNKLQEKLMQAQKMEAIGTLAGGIAHDFNNVLTGIIGFTELAGQGIPTDSKARKDLAQVLESANRAKELVRQILRFSRQSKQEKTLVAFDMIVKEALKLVRASVPAFIEIRQELMSEDSFIWADPTEIHQVIINLCTNAYHAIGDKSGEIKVALNKINLEEGDFQRYPESRIGGYIKLSISDSGEGIDPTIKDRIFEPYFTTKAKELGSGMGLSIVHGIVKSYDGFMIVDSELGVGTTFDVFIPVCTGKVIENANIAEIIPTGNEKILVVDDEASIAEVEKQILTNLGYNILLASNGAMALDIFRHNPNDFDLIITDQTMPRLSGVELSEAVLKIRPDMSIIICSGYSSIINEESIKNTGIKAYCTKPFRSADIAKLVRRILDEAKK